eukprot:5759243-Prymnesium_polylepis.1
MQSFQVFLSAVEDFFVSLVCQTRERRREQDTSRARIHHQSMSLLRLARAPAVRLAPCARRLSTAIQDPPISTARSISPATGAVLKEYDYISDATVLEAVDSSQAAFQ